MQSLPSASSASLRRSRPDGPSVSGSALARAMLLLFAALAPSCGGSNPAGPSGPKAGGPITGRYTLELVPAVSCNGRTVSFLVEVTQTGTSPHAGNQLLLVGADPAILELELKYTEDTLEGGIGTTGDGVPSSQGPQVWVNAIASGKTTQTSDDRGEAVSGTLRGYVEIEGVMNACSAPNHGFTLRAK